MKKLLFIALFFVILPFIKTAPVLAADAGVEGKIFVTIDGRKVYIPGVVLVREDNNDAGVGNPWGGNKGPFSVSLATPEADKGKYGFYSLLTLGAPAGCDNISDNNKNCPQLTIGQNPSDALACDGAARHIHCGLSCNQHNTPQRWLAYFPPNFDTSVLPAGVSFKANDMKGGGSWKVKDNAGSGSMSVKAGGGNWVVSAANFGQVTYGAKEWYQADASSNYGGVGDLDIEWIPGVSPMACASLTKSPTTDAQIGDKLIFTCSKTAATTDFNHYEYRIHRPGDPTDKTLDTYWYLPSGWNNLQGSTPEYTLPSNGSYEVQCRVCGASNVCTAWGQAN